MNTFWIIYIVIGIILGGWGVHRQLQRWSGNSIWRLISVFLINAAIWFICLPLALYKGVMFKNKNEVRKPISSYKPN